MSQMSHQMSLNVTLVTFSVRKMENRLWNIPVRTDPKSCLRRILFHKKSGLRRNFFVQIFLKQGCIWFEVSYCVYQFIGCENDSNTNIEWSQRHSLYQTVIKIVSNNKSFVGANLLRYKSHSIFNSKPVYKKQRTAGEMPQLNTYRFWRDQALRLFCLKGHFRARGSTLWRHRWLGQEASEILCTKTTLFGGSWATKNIVKKTQKCSFRRAANVTKKKNCAPRCSLKSRFARF